MFLIFGLFVTQSNKKITKRTFFLHFPKSFINLQPLIKYSFLLRVFGFIKKGGEIRLGETLATNPEKNGKRCQNLIPENREMIK
jgi:hypothetical protein